MKNKKVLISVVSLAVFFLLFLPIFPIAQISLEGCFEGVCPTRPQLGHNPIAQILLENISGFFTSPPVSTTLKQCESDGDCALAIRLDRCCSCPEAIDRYAIKKDKNLREYILGKNYSDEIRLDCQKFNCAPCALGEKAICQEGRCQKVFWPEGLSDPRRLCGTNTYRARCLNKAVYRCGDKYKVVSSCSDDFDVILDQRGNFIAYCGGFAGYSEWCKSLINCTQSEMICGGTIPSPLQKYICPKNNTVDCMPIIEGEKKWYCSPEYLTWAKKNCPEFTIAY